MITAEQRVYGLINNLTGLHPLDMQRHQSFVHDLEFDSLDLVELIMDVEDEFSLEISDEDVETFLKLDDLVKYIENHLNEAR